MFLVLRKLRYLTMDAAALRPYKKFSFTLMRLMKLINLNQ